MILTNPIHNQHRPKDVPFRATRYAVHWKVGIMYKKDEKNEVFHGRTFEVSSTGTSFLSQHNIFFGGEVTALLALPWYRDNQTEKIIQIRSRVIHTILSSENQSFRTGLQFLEFKGDTGHLLEIALRDQPKVNR